MPYSMQMNLATLRRPSAKLYPRRGESKQGFSSFSSDEAKLPQPLLHLLTATNSSRSISASVSVLLLECPYPL
ncbi:hypothetical protein HAX54_039117, partial [Datura stramonium]|nr:hypothetical protein [Datura stramonium]